MDLYDSSAKNNYITKNNPTFEEILPYLQCGDVLTYTGHTFLVYDLLYDESGNVSDAYILQSSFGPNNYYVKSKIPTTSSGGLTHYLYYGSKVNTNYEEGLNEGTLNLSKLSLSPWKNIDKTSKKNEYSILRFVQNDNNGNIVLNYQGENYNDKNHTNEIIALSAKDNDRLKFSKLYIEKTVDVRADSIVEVGDQLTYTITIKNNSNSNYTNFKLCKSR